ncbi:MAG: beta strand repeat-containing protein, partial [Bacteroidota bacterium]
ILKVSPTATTSYAVTVVDNNGCSATVNRTVTVNSLPVPTVTSTPPNCPTSTTGTALASAGSGWSYLWSSGATTAGITGLPQGLYVVTVTDVNGCNGTASASLVDAATPITIVASKTDVVCYGAQTGAISLAVTGGTSSYTYAWSANASAATTANLTSLPKGNYAVTVTEIGGNSCRAVSTIEILEPSFGMQLNLLVKENSGALANDGTICTSESATIKVNALPNTGATISSYSWSVTGNTNDSLIVNSAGTYSVTVTDNRSCVASATSSAITVTPANTVGSSSPSDTLCVNTLLTNITHTTTGATGIGTATGLPAGVTAVWASNTITISGTPTIVGVYNYNIPLTGGCGNLAATGTITVTQLTTVSLASTSPTLCNNTLLTDIIHTTTGTTGIGTPVNLPDGVTATWSNNTLTISGTPTASGTFYYTIPIIGGCGSVNATGTINVTQEMTVSAGNSATTLCINTPLTGLSHLTSGGTTGIGTPTGLPAGLTASWAFSTISIVGTPTESGTFNYSIPLSGGCGTVSATGTIIVTPANTASAASSSPTLCINTPLTNNITITTTGATGISSFSGLPAFVSASWNSNVITISGTPTTSGVFNYSVSLSGGCGDVNATGTMTVTPENTASAPSSTPTLCINTPLADIIHTTTTATGIGTATGLPNGVTTQWVSNRLIILGTPTNSGIFTYTVPLTGGCGSVNATGTITVTPVNTVSAASSTPTLCVYTSLTTIKHSTVGATGIDTTIGLPSGLTANWSSDTIFITGTPEVSGIFRYEIRLSGGCGVSIATGTITVTPANTVTIASSSPTLCVNTTLTNITHRTRGATGIGAARGLPDGVTAAWAADVITISGKPLVSGVYVYLIPLTGGCDTLSAIGVIRVTPVNIAGAASSTPTLCINTVLTNITHTTTGVTGIGSTTGLPTGVLASWASDRITLSGTPTVSGIFNYSILLTGGCDSVTATGTITVNPDNTVGAASSTPTLCINTALTNITHATTSATGIGTATGLPAGVSAAWSANVITISGTPTASGTFTYSIPLTGACGSLSATGTVIVTPANTVDVASSTPTLCINTALTNITHVTTGATGIGTATGLPAGVSAAWSANVITISGTPTASGTFTYSIPLTGACGSLSATGTVIVTPANTVDVASSTPTLCINTALTNITHITTGTTGIGAATGLPAGVSAAWSANVITISGTPTASGTFNYSIPLIGECNSLSATGTITVTPANTVGVASSTPTLCINTALTNITHATTGATGIGTATGLPAGVSAAWSANVITISGTPTASGTFNY